MSGQNETPSPPVLRSKRKLWIVLGGLLVLLLVLPWILAKTPLRDRFLSTIVNDDDLRLQSRDASFGYFSPFSLSGLRIESRREVARVSVETIAADQSWLGMWLSRPDLGTFRFERPTLEVRIDPNRLDRKKADRTDGEPVNPAMLPNLTVEVREAAVKVVDAKSASVPIDLKNINLTFHVERQQNMSVLRVEPTTVFDQQALTPELCGQGLQLVAPLLADELSAEGTFSLHLRELDVALGDVPESSDRPVRVAGEIELHSASVALKNTATQNLIALVAALLGETLPDRLTVAEGVKVKFAVVDGRVQHEGLALLLPHRDDAIEIVSSGSVGLDETLDLQVSIQLPTGMLGDSALANRFVAEPLVVAVTGTLQEPVVGLAEDVDWLRAAQSLLSKDGAAVPGLQNTLTDLIGGLLEQSSARRADQQRRNADRQQAEGNVRPDPSRDQRSLDQPLFPKLRDRIRQRLQQQQAEPEHPIPL